MRELREKTFSGNKTEDANEHVEHVLYIVRTKAMWEQILEVKLKDRIIRG